MLYEGGVFLNLFIIVSILKKIMTKFKKNIRCLGCFMLIVKNMFFELVNVFL